MLFVQIYNLKLNLEQDINGFDMNQSKKYMHILIQSAAIKLIEFGHEFKLIK